MVDETKVEQTAASSSEETKPAEAQEGDKQVPYNRFKEVVEEKNKYKELLNAQQETLGVEKTAKTTQEQIKEIETQTGTDYTDALKIIDTRVEEKLAKKLESVNRQIDLDRTIASNPDFYQFADIIKEKIKDNPHLTWGDAYKLARFDSTLLRAKEEGKQEAYRKIDEKKKASVESAVKTKAVLGQDGEIDPMAKSPDGKYIHSLKDLEDILPKK
jgi:hypothetical protein